MKKVVKEFEFIFKCGENETIYNFKGVVKPSYSGNYRIIVSSKSYENGILKSRNYVQYFYHDLNVMAEEFEYHFNTCKNSLFKKSIKIINS